MDNITKMTQQHNNTIQTDDIQTKLNLATDMTRCSSFHRLLAFPCFVLCIVTLYNVIYDMQLFQVKCTSDDSKSKQAEAVPNHIRPFKTPDLRLNLGDLPGYTGWARPSNTLAPYFQVVNVNNGKEIVAGQNVSLTVHCSIEACRKGNSLFYLRAYGSSIIPGISVDHQNGTYDFFFVPHDLGPLLFEAVMTFSQASSLDLAPSSDNANYEGFLLPGFPMSLVVKNSNPTSSLNPAKSNSTYCRFNQLVESSMFSAVQTGRWMVKQKVASQTNYQRSIKESGRRSNMESGWNSLGFTMEYKPIGCELMSDNVLGNPKVLLNALRHTRLPQKPLHVLFIGDSNTRIQFQRFERCNYFGSLARVTFIPTNGGLVMKFNKIKKLLKNITDNFDDNFFVLFNSGLHSIYELCDHSRESIRATYLNISDENFSCVAMYRDYLRKFVHLIRAFPAVLRVFQTTSAAWPKWGVVGAAWPWTFQRFPLDTSSCHYFNNIAWDVIHQLEYDDNSILETESKSNKANISVMDAFWLSYARPEHRQVDEKNSLAGRLMHAGPEIYDVLVRKWSMMILETIINY